MDEDVIADINELIAIFDDWKLETELETNVQFFIRGRRKIYHYDLEYHSSWDWLMRVVEKIKKDNWVKIEFKEDYTFCVISSPQLGADPIVLEERVEDMAPIRVVWDAVITYIKWYNEKDDRRGKGRI